MPRLSAPDEEDLLVECPRCQGSGAVVETGTGLHVTCRMCDGLGRVTPARRAAYLRRLHARNDG
jgi:DnaJ-class molecular chaperone